VCSHITGMELYSGSYTRTSRVCSASILDAHRFGLDSRSVDPRAPPRAPWTKLTSASDACCSCLNSRSAVLLLHLTLGPPGCVRHPSWMHIASAWTPGRRSPRAPRIELSRLNPRSATSTAPKTIKGGGFAVGCVLVGMELVDGGGLLERALASMLVPPPKSNSLRFGLRLRDLHEDARL